jgi:hypothetical protein
MSDRLSVKFYSSEFDPEKFKQEFVLKREKFLSLASTPSISLADKAIRAGFNSYLDYVAQLNIYRQLV